MSDVLVKALVEDPMFKDIPWYVSTKQWGPDWQPLLKNVHCRMFFIPQAAVDTAKRQAQSNKANSPSEDGGDDKHRVTRWINSKGLGTKEALRFLSSLAALQQREEKSPPLLIATPSGHRILAIWPNWSDTEQKDGKMIVQNERDTFLNPMPIETPFASILFGALIAHDLHFKKKNTYDFEKHIKGALNFTRDYVESENKRVTSPESWKPEDDEKILEIEDKSKIEDQPKIQGKFYWNTKTTVEIEKKRWNQATEGLGLIEEDGELRLELFRAANEVDGYICLGKEKKHDLQRLIMELKGFINGPKEKSSSCMITAPPGSGKTRLANLLASAEGYNFITFNQ